MEDKSSIPKSWKKIINFRYFDFFTKKFLCLNETFSNNAFFFSFFFFYYKNSKNRKNKKVEFLVQLFKQLTLNNRIKQKIEAIGKSWLLQYMQHVLVFQNRMEWKRLTDIEIETWQLEYWKIYSVAFWTR